MRIAVLMLLGGCYVPYPKTDGTDTDTTSSLCPDGMVEPLVATVTIPRLTLNGLSYTTSFDRTAVYDGRPTACVSPDGTEALVTITSAGEPFATVRYSGTTVGNFTTEQFTGDLSLDLFGFEFPDVIDTEWNQGSYTFTELGPAFRGAFSGEGASDDVTVFMSITIDASP